MKARGHGKDAQYVQGTISVWTIVESFNVMFSRLDRMNARNAHINSDVCLSILRVFS